MSFLVPVHSWNSCLGESSDKVAGPKARLKCKDSDYVILADGEAVSSWDDTASNDELVCWKKRPRQISRC
jgi:hypothetical protein